jgi:hypothetical protein
VQIKALEEEEEEEEGYCQLFKKNESNSLCKKFLL